MTAFTMTGAEPDEVWPLVRDHHYSGRMPANIQHCYAVRRAGGLFGDTGEVVAAIVFTIPPTKWAEEVTELARLVRHPDYKEPLTRLLSFAALWIRRKGWNLAVSFADWTQRHHGGIYQAADWRYHGMRAPAMDGLIIDGVFKPGRSCNSAFGTRSPTRLAEKLPDSEIQPGKTKARRLGLQSLPYPKPNAVGPLDELPPGSASQAQPLKTAPAFAALSTQERGEK